MKKLVATMMGIVLLLAAANVYACNGGSACVKKTDVKKSASINKSNKVFAGVDIYSKNRIDNSAPSISPGQKSKSFNKNSNSAKPIPGPVKPIFKGIVPSLLPYFLAQNEAEIQAEFASVNAWNWKAPQEFVQE